MPIAVARCSTARCSSAPSKRATSCRSITARSRKPSSSCSSSRARLLPAADLEALVADAHLERGLRRGRRSLSHAAVAAGETRAVTAADDLVALERAFAERAAAVRTAVVDGVELLAVAQQQHRRVVDDHARRLPVPQL